MATHEFEDPMVGITIIDADDSSPWQAIIEVSPVETTEVFELFFSDPIKLRDVAAAFELGALQLERLQDGAIFADVAETFGGVEDDSILTTADLPHDFRAPE